MNVASVRARRAAGACVQALAFAALLLSPVLAGGLDYPKARTVDQVDRVGDVEVRDPYRWLENVDDPEVQAWVEKENGITRGYLDQLGTRPQIAKRLTELLDYPRIGLPVEREAWTFFSKNTGLQNQSVIYKQKAGGAPTVLIDPNAMSKDGTISISGLSYSRDGALAGYGLSQSGSDWQTLHVRDVASGKDRKDVLERCRFTSIAWAPDRSGFYYSRYPWPGTVAKEDEEYWQKLYFHKLGDDQKKDRLVYERTDNRECGASAGVSDDGHWLIVSVWKGTAPENEIHVQRLGAPGTAIEPLFTGFDASWDFVESVDDKLYFTTNKDAPRKRVVVVDMTGTDRTPREIVAAEGDVLEFASIANRKLFLGYMHNAHHRLLEHGLDGKRLREVGLPTLGSIGNLSGGPDDADLYVSFTSFLFPSQNYKYDFATGKLVLHQKAEIDFDPEAFTARQVWYESKDGTLVPMFLVHQKGLVLDGNNPTLLYGYGGFNNSLTPTFSTSRLFWLEQGGVYALANLRGGGEFGEEWHKAGTLDRKQNVFDDFIAAGEWLCGQGITQPSRLAIQGGSNGGLLTAACALQRPDLYGCVLSQVPVIDMMRYHKFTIGAYWKPDYGDPENPEHAKFLMKYSPAHNVKPGTRFPSMLITTADTDTRVHPMHAKKFAAAVQAANTGDNPTLLRVETKAGHGAGKPTSKIIEEQADLYSFMLDRLRMQLGSGTTSARRGLD